MEISSNRNSLYLIDATGPFHQQLEEDYRADWSSLPWSRFAALEDSDFQNEFDDICEDVNFFARGVSNIGFLGVILGDVHRLTLHSSYSAEVKAEISRLRPQFREIFSIFSERGLRIYLTMNLVGMSERFEKQPYLAEKRLISFTQEILSQFFEEFPEIAGVVLCLDQRLSDDGGMELRRGKNPRYTPRKLNHLLRAVLPIFEKEERICLFRPWAQDSQPGCDLIWRDARLKRTLQGIESEALVLSLRSSETGDYRYSSINRNFFLTDFPTIVELDARRKHEGCGEFPSFAGYHFEKIAIALRDASHNVGFAVSCQGGGRSPFRRRAFLDENAIWTDMNVFVALRMFRFGELVEEALSRLPHVRNPLRLAELLRLSDEVVTELLYLPEFGRQTLFLRGKRVPPMLGVCGHHLIISHRFRKILKRCVGSPDECVRRGISAMAKIQRMRMLALECLLPEEDVEFMQHTLATLALAREYYFDQEDRPEHLLALRNAVSNYRSKYRKTGRSRFSIRLDLEKRPWRLSQFWRWWKSAEPKGRLVDRLLEIQLFSLLHPWLRRTRPPGVVSVPKAGRERMIAFTKE